MSVSIASMIKQPKGVIRLLEAHDQVSADIIRRRVRYDDQSFQGIWWSGLSQTTHLGIPDTELVSPLKRATMLPPCPETERYPYPGCAAFDADSGGNLSDIPALVAVLETKGVSMIIIEDKALPEPGKKLNSLLGTCAAQAQADMNEFVKVIQTFKSASQHREIMITARIESLTGRVPKMEESEENASVENALRDAHLRAEVYVKAGADAIMIHSKSRHPDEVLSFLKTFRAKDLRTPLVVVPTTYSTIPRAALCRAGANVIIYANHLIRAKIEAVATASDRLLASKPGLFSNDTDIKACIEARNFACALRILSERTYSGGNEDQEAKSYSAVAEHSAIENMTAVVEELAAGLVALQALSKKEDRAVATSTRNLLRALGGAAGVAISTATQHSTVKTALRHIGVLQAGQVGLRTFEKDILDAQMKGFRVVFAPLVPLMALCLLGSLLIPDTCLKEDGKETRESEEGIAQSIGPRP
ncbi:putative phosphoenolpyruvate phosphomutase [Aspergillus nomiae NRRL 13137]|uniref:Putative phosphoenolpyruvate phosphomutase n=1 Tax=Aspergillus nomiae NRRL (strain ATCC 15546 / NRRL 13137 / CBS 260.88 / M93) TaxID=1509407 RepID=A0A0L1JGI2_ASPN3|nr:putative phosphoenolpyruvate phosphomutase [Aspergillus nomiae NRRL 13137]KNG90871.1 putative phosphoenolpyruvate phosphomutase [Aspergillus nomiae NRRL 13137]